MSWLLGTSGIKERVFPGPQNLEDEDDDDDSDDEFSYPCHSVCPSTQCKSYDSSSDSQVEDMGESNPFSLNPGHSYMMKDNDENIIYANILAKHALNLEDKVQKFQEPSYKDTEMLGSVSEDEDHSWTYHFPLHQRSHVLQTANMAPCDSYDSLWCSMGKHLEMDAFAPWTHASDPYLGDPEHTEGAEPHTLHEEAIRNSEFPSLQLTNDLLRENAKLRRALSSMQSSLESQAGKIQKLEKQLEDSLAKRERETEKLQSVVQQTEWSLQLMTQRALEAESKVEMLKQEIFILQGELKSSKVENENLRAGQMTDPEVVKHNIDFALQSLYKIIMGANWSIKQLTSGAESLYFVAEILKSIGKISEVEAERKQ